MSAIMVGYEGSDRSRDALDLARRLAGVTGAKLHLALVYPEGRSLRRDAERVLAQAPTGLHAELHPVAASSAARGLTELAEELGAAVVVVGSTRHGPFGRIQPGATGELLLHGGPCAVAVAPIGYARHADERPGHVGVAVAGGEASEAALGAAVELARALQVPLRIVGVVDHPPPLVPIVGQDEFVESDRRARRRQVEEALAGVPEDVTAEAEVLDGPPADMLCALTGLDLLVLGSRGYGRVKGSLLGSVSTKVVRGAASPVLVVRAGDPPFRCRPPAETAAHA